MAITKEIEIKVDVDDSDLKGLEKSFKKVSENLEKVDSSADKASKGIRGISTSTKVLGVAFKALGIGLVVALIAKLTEVFSKNQRVVDFVSTAMETLSIAFNDFFNFIFDNSGKVTGFFKEIFENPLKSVEKLGDLIKENLIERFNSLIEVAGFLGSALKKLFAGDFAGALDAVKEAGKEAIDVFTGVDDTFGKVSEGISTIIEKGGEYLTQTLAQAKANVQLANTSQLAAAQQARLVEQFDRLAEKQRQIRDNESISIKERQAANKKLGQILEEQEKAIIRQADLQVAAAAAQARTNNNIENQVALTEALANKEGVLAAIEGFRSEQIVNRIALKKEEIELNNSISEAEKERRLAQLEFEERQEETELGKLEKLQESLDLENQLILEDLERKRELFALGTQARVDAEQDFLNKKQALDNRSVELEKQNNKLKEEDEQRLKDAKIQIASTTLNVLGQLAKEGSALSKGIAASQATINTFQGVTAALSATSVIPEPFGTILKFANAAAIGIAGAINVNKILATKPITTSAGDLGGGGGAAAPAAPSFNLVAGTGVNQIAEGLASQSQPIKAFVVSSEVSTAQSLDRNIEEEAGI